METPREWVGEEIRIRNDEIYLLPSLLIHARGGPKMIGGKIQELRKIR